MIANIPDRHNVKALLITAVAVLLVEVPALSHDYWFEPEEFFVSVGERKGLCGQP